jgi:hypothetical protein
VQQWIGAGQGGIGYFNMFLFTHECVSYKLSGTAGERPLPQ